jgi:hypothetical protein
VRLALALGIGCAVAIAGSAAADDDPPSGVRGQVRIAPTCPVQRPGEQCSRGYETKIRIVRLPERTFVKRIETGEHGHFRTKLPPGRYKLTPRGGENRFPSCRAYHVTVRPEQFTRVRIVCDTGIR